MIAEFFRSLAEYGTENNLSDVTYYLAAASPEFRRRFLSSIFPEISLGNIEEVELEREITSDDRQSRVDFRVNTRDLTYLIENKIYDRNYHLEQYRKSFPGITIGFIANYDVKNIDGYKYKMSWADIYKKIRAEVYQIDKPEERLLVEGYLEYLKEVCNIMEHRDFYPMYTKDVEYISNLIESCLKSRSIEINNMGKSSDETRFGKKFTLNIKKKTRNFWIGFYTTEYYNGLVIECEMNPQLLKSGSFGKYSGIPYEESGNVYIELNEENLVKLNSVTETIAGKHEIVDCFLGEVIEGIKTTF